MPITRIGTGSGKVIKDSVSGSFTTSAFGFTPSALNGLALSCSLNDGSNSITAVTAVDNLGANWIVKPSARSAGGNFAFVLYRLGIPAGITSVTVTLVGAGTCFCVYSLDEFAGIGAFDKTNSATGSSNPTPLATGSISNSGATDLVLACWGSDDSANGAWAGTAASAPWTTLHSETDTTAHHASFAAFLIDTATSTFNPTAGYSVETSAAAAVIASFSPAAAASVNMGSMRMVMP